ncbi:MAG: starch-binding protein [Anaeroplasmataceae bacterium]|nr:starch-binding protein [Anaeroplasmataceae bacterium]
MKKIFKGLMFAIVGLFGVVALASCTTKEKHKWTWENDATKHRQVCSDCSEKTEWEAHVWGEWKVTEEATEDKKGSKEHTCTVCNYTATEAIAELAPELGVSTQITAVYAQVPATWETVYIYYWNNLTGEDNTLEEGYNVAWPGVEMTLINADTHMYGYKIPAGVNMVIFNNGSAQTVDIPFATGKNLYVLNSDVNSESKYEIVYRSYTAQTTDPELSDPVSSVVEKLDVYVKAPTTWETVCIHYFGGALETSWPGETMELVNADENIYKFNVPAGSTFIINNNAGSQTSNLQFIENVNAYIIDEYNSISYGKYENGVLTPVEVHIIPVYYFCGGPTNWAFSDENKLVVDGTTASITVELKAGEEFKVCTTAWDSPQYGDFCEGISVSSNIVADTAGTYVLTVLDYDTAPVLTITRQA